MRHETEEMGPNGGMGNQQQEQPRWPLLRQSISVPWREVGLIQDIHVGPLVVVHKVAVGHVGELLRVAVFAGVRRDHLVCDEVGQKVRAAGGWKAHVGGLYRRRMKRKDFVPGHHPIQLVTSDTFLHLAWALPSANRHKASCDAAPLSASRSHTR